MKKIFLNESEKKKLISEKEKMIIESFAKNFNKIKRVDENEIETGNQIDQNTTLAYKIVKKITNLIKDDVYVEPDEYGMSTSPLLKTFYYNFSSVDDPDGKLIGWKRGDVKGFTKRVKSYLSNMDIILVNDGGSIDIKNSNHPEVAKLVKKLETL
jgi:hypothetical protein